jgi:sporulation protein YlmC with PRC-barrel domain
MPKFHVTQVFFAAVAGALVATGGVFQIWAADPQYPNTPNPTLQTQNPNLPNTIEHPAVPADRALNISADRTLVIKTLPSKKIVGAGVINTKGETLGSIDDVVVDLESGKLGYAALSVGGVLGIGDKLFAVPFEDFKITHDTNNNISFVLDVSKERLENAPGFDKNHWPDFASPQWKSQIDGYYHPSSASRPANDVSNPQNR